MHLTYSISTCLSDSIAVSLIEEPLLFIGAVGNGVVEYKLGFQELLGSLRGDFTDHHRPLEVHLECGIKSQLVTSH